MKKTLLTLGLAMASLIAVAEAPTYDANYWVDSQNSQDASSRVAISQSTDGSFFTLNHFGSFTTDDYIEFDGEKVATGAATTSNSDCRNLLLIKHAADGHRLWSVSSRRGYIDVSSEGNIAPTSDGGVVVLLNARASQNPNNDTPILVDASGAEIEFPEWNTSVWIYNQILMKVSKDGNVQWVKNIVMDQLPVPNATASAAKVATTNGVTPYALAVDENDNIFIGGNYRAPMIFNGEGYATYVLTPRNVENYSGDSQAAAGGLYIIKLDAEGQYLKHVKATGELTRDQVCDFAIDGTTLYFAGNVQGAEEATLTVGDKSITMPNTLDGIAVGSINTADMSCNWLSLVKAYGASTGKHTTQIKSIMQADGKLYVTGAMMGGFGAAESTAAAFASVGTPLESFVVELSATDGEFIGGVANGLSIGAYTGAFKRGEKLYFYGYRLMTTPGIFLDEYNVGSWELVNRNWLATGGGMPTSYGAAYNPANTRFYALSRGNNVITFGDDVVTEKPQSWAGNISCYYFDEQAAAIDGIAAEAAASFSVAGEEGAVVVNTTEETRLNIVDTKGISVYNATIPAGQSRIALTPGIYIANSQKVLVK